MQLYMKFRRLAFSGLKVAPAQGRGKAGEIGIRRYPFAAALDGERGMHRIGDDFALKVAFFRRAA
jgi:hypothetical protein